MAESISLRLLPTSLSPLLVLTLQRTEQSGGNGGLGHYRPRPGHVFETNLNKNQSG